ncbi:hypothetical protein JNJ66_07580 [Candidatus Saccharibacteria bacterium]|nr:hypothetical protein [Candidatus Saccharibacteria bacterium]
MSLAAFSSALLLSVGTVSATSGLNYNHSKSYKVADYKDLGKKHGMLKHDYQWNKDDHKDKEKHNDHDKNYGHDYGKVVSYGHGGHSGNTYNHANNYADVDVYNKDHGKHYGGGWGGYGYLPHLLSYGSKRGGIALTGPASYNLVDSRVSNNYSLYNLNTIGIYNNNDQVARSGSSSSDFNTIGGGGGRTGDAVNKGSNDANVFVNNGSGGNSFRAYNNGAVSTGGIFLTGPFSTNIVRNSVSNDYQKTNVNVVRADNSNSQTAASGSSSSDFNTIGGFGGHGNSGGSGSGDTANKADNSANVVVDNSSNSNGYYHATGNTGYGGSGGSIGITGPGSYNVVSTDVQNNYSETNANMIDLSNQNDQWAQSGNSSSDVNTFGGWGAGGTGDAVNKAVNDANVVVAN